MKHRIALVIALLSIISLIGCKQKDPILLTATEISDGWTFRQADKEEWLPATVPGSVHTDLMKNGKIEDPFYRLNEHNVQWIDKVNWEYKTNFNIDPVTFTRDRIALDFKGLDTYADVFVNDTKVLSADNMFREWMVDIKPQVKEGVNELRILFRSPIVEGLKKYDANGYVIPVSPNDLAEIGQVEGNKMVSVYTRKAGYHFGWDWGPRMVSSGLWRPVFLTAWDDARIENLQLKQNQVSEKEATLTAVFEIEANADSKATITVENEGVELANADIQLTKGISTYPVDFKIANPKLWWTNGLGEAHLYNIKGRLALGKRFTEKTERIGIRTLELIRDKDNKGTSFYYKLNGVPVFMKGANYIPNDIFPARVTDEMYKKVINTSKISNFNMLRVWGGGIYEYDRFYDLCDENGILVWQDFMFACAMYPNNKEFLSSIRDEAIQNVVRLRRHPSIALWCGNNEIDEGWKNWGWQKQYGYSKQDSTEIHKNYRTIFNDILPNIVFKFDTLRYYTSTSPQNGWGRPQSLKQGDMHYWGVWWGKEPFSNYEKKIPRFMSEYGFQGFPDPSTVELFTLPEERILGSDVMKAHQKHPTGYETIDEYLLRDYKKPKDFDSYNYVSQLLQAKGVSMAIQAHRRAKPRCMGTLFWQLNDCWPVVSWSARDSYGKKKALWHEVKKQFVPMLVSPVVEEGHVKVYISSDNIYIERDTMQVRLYDFDGNVLMDEKYYVEIPPENSSVFYDTLLTSLLKDADSARCVFNVTLASGQDGSLLSRNNLYFSSPKDLKLQKPEIMMRAIEIPAGYRILIVSDQLVKNARLSTSVVGEFKDNYFDILPGEIYDVYFYTKERDEKITEKIEIKSLIDTY